MDLSSETWLGASFSNLVSTTTSYTLTSGAVQWVYAPEGPDGINGLCIASGCTSFTPNPPTTTLQVVTLAVNSSMATGYQDYTNPVTASGTISLTSYPGMAQVAYSTTTDTQTTYWFRVRAYPPGNVMPSVQFGSITVEDILAVANTGSTSWLANLVVYSSTNTGRLSNLTLAFRNPSSKQAVLGTVTNQLSGPQVTLVASATILIALAVSVNAGGTTTVTLGLKIEPANGERRFGILLRHNLPDGDLTS